MANTELPDLRINSRGNLKCYTESQVLKVEFTKKPYGQLKRLYTSSAMKYDF